MAGIITETAIARDITILADSGTIDVEEIEAWSSERYLSRYLHIFPAGDSYWRSRANPQVTVGRALENRVALLGCTGARWAYRGPPPYSLGLVRPFELGWPPYTVRLDVEVTFDVSDDTDAELLIASRIIGAPAGADTDSVISIEINGPGGEVYSLETSTTTDRDSFWTVGTPGSGQAVELVAGEHTMTAYVEKPQSVNNYYVFFQAALSLVP